MGVNHTVVITSDSSVYTAGSGSHGQLGVKPQDGSPMFLNIHKLEFEERAIDVACGEEFTLLLSGTNDIYPFRKRGHLLIR